MFLAVFCSTKTTGVDVKFFHFHQRISETFRVVDVVDFGDDVVDVVDDVVDDVDFGDDVVVDVVVDVVSFKIGKTTSKFRRRPR